MTQIRCRNALPIASHQIFNIFMLNYLLHIELYDKFLIKFHRFSRNFSTKKAEAIAPTF